MSEFWIYFVYGYEHILDYKDGYDHILFIVALCALYLMRDWKRVLILVTAFTIGHSITLALSSLQIINAPRDVVEFLIALTIFITAFSNLFKKEQNLGDRKFHLNYFYALFFGLIHGLGFSNLLRTILGKNNIVAQLFAFNLGLEIGQIIVVAIFLVSSFLFVDIFGIARRDWKIVLSSMIAGMALLLMKERIFWLDHPG